MARDSFAAADGALGSGHLRSASSRYYYAAYQAATALILYRSLTPPDEREAWSHDDTRNIVANGLSTLISEKGVRKALRTRLVLLYELRIRADYKASTVLENTETDKARRDAGFILQLVENIIVKGRLQ